MVEDVIHIHLQLEVGAILIRCQVPLLKHTEKGRPASRPFEYSSLGVSKTTIGRDGEATAVIDNTRPNRSIGITTSNNIGSAPGTTDVRCIHAAEIGRPPRSTSPIK